MIDMKIKDIRQQPTVIDNEHASLYREYHVLAMVRELLEKETPYSVILEMIELCYVELGETCNEVETVIEDIDTITRKIRDFSNIV